MMHVEMLILVKLRPEAIKRYLGVHRIMESSGFLMVFRQLSQHFKRSLDCIVLAEIDVSLRALVCAELGYRPDQTWGRIKHGSASLCQRRQHPIEG